MEVVYIIDPENNKNFQRFEFFIGAPYKYSIEIIYKNRLFVPSIKIEGVFFRSDSDFVLEIIECIKDNWSPVNILVDKLFLIIHTEIIKRIPPQYIFTKKD